jgi:hypothetical protein
MSRAEGILDAAVETFHHIIRLWVVGCCLAVVDVEQAAHKEEVSWVPQSDVLSQNLLTHP